jgi:hypothetical protein
LELRLRWLGALGTITPVNHLQPKKCWSLAMLLSEPFRPAFFPASAASAVPQLSGSQVDAGFAKLSNNALHKAQQTERSSVAPDE